MSLREVNVEMIGFFSERDTDRLLHLIAEHDRRLGHTTDNPDHDES